MPTRSRPATMRAAASSPMLRRSVVSVVLRLARALVSSTSGQKTAATRVRGCSPG